MNRTVPSIALAACLFFYAVPQVTGGQLRVVALTGVAVPGAEKSFDGFGNVSLNNLGQVAFNPWQFPNQFRIDSGGVWIASPGQALVQVDPPAWGHWDVVINDVGQASFTNGGALERGNSLSEAQSIARYGQPAPGVIPSGSAFTNFFNYTGASLNNRNEVAFVGTAAGWNRLWVGKTSDSLTLIASAGQELTHNNQTRTIQGIGVPLINDYGEVLVSIRLWDGTPGASQQSFAS